ncbi:MAG: hypothetical protein GY898_12880 [Proteobacteria bacterium]|nr:hypothetical protein [Pseudomonadota bacterium]
MLCPALLLLPMVATCSGNPVNDVRTAVDEVERVAKPGPKMALSAAVPSVASATVRPVEDWSLLRPATTTRRTATSKR